MFCVTGKEKISKDEEQEKKTHFNVSNINFKSRSYEVIALPLRRHLCLINLLEMIQFSWGLRSLPVHLMGFVFLSFTTYLLSLPPPPPLSRRVPEDVIRSVCSPDGKSLVLLPVCPQ